MGATKEQTVNLLGDILLELTQIRGLLSPHVVDRPVEVSSSKSVDAECVLADVRDERASQRRIFSFKGDDEHDCEDWYNLVEEHATKYLDASDDDEKRHELVVVAALAVAAIEALDRCGG